MQYLKDNRLPISEIYSSYNRLTNFKKETIYFQKFSKYKFPILSFKSKKKGPAIYLISGIHGEEPAGVVALSLNIDFLNKLAKKIPIIIFPLCNPKGYFLNKRYPEKGKSVGSSEHFLLNKKSKARLSRPENLLAFLITKKVVQLSKDYPPIFSLDFHEDRSYTYPYIYSHGILGANDPIAKKIVSIIKSNKLGIQMSGNTSFKERIKRGIISNIKDGSIDELLSAKEIIVNNKIAPGPNAKSVVVVETQSLGVPLKKRVLAHSSIIKAIPEFLRLSRQDF